MKMFASLVLLLVLGVLGAVQAGCRRTERAHGRADPLRIGASPVPHAAILEHVKPALARDGITLEVVEMTDYVQPNLALVDRTLDGNFFQHQPYLEAFNRDRGAELVAVARVHVEPLGVYSKKVRALGALGPDAIVAIPNDPTNTARALELLQAAGVLRLGPAKEPTARDVIAGPKTPRLRELEGAQLPRVLVDVDAAVINGNYALEAGLIPSRDAIVREDASSRYANVLVARADRATDERLEALVKELTRESTRRFIEERFRGSLVPAF